MLIFQSQQAPEIPYQDRRMMPTGTVSGETYFIYEEVGIEHPFITAVYVVMLVQQGPKKAKIDGALLV
jgi:hypothetical protein